MKTILFLFFSISLCRAQERPELVIPLGHSNLITSWAIAPNGLHLITGSKDRSLKLWNLVRHKEMRTFRGHQGEITDILFSPDGQTVYSAGYDGVISLWEVASGKRIQTFDARMENFRGEKFGSVNSLSLGKKILVSGGSQILVWEPRSGKKLQTIPQRTHALALTPDETSVLCVYEGSLTLWNLETGQMIRKFGQYSYDYTKPELFITQDGKYAYTRLNRNMGIQIWDMRSGQFIGNVTEKSTLAMALSPDGPQMAIAYNRNYEKDFVEIFDTQTLQSLTKISCPDSFQNKEVKAIRFIHKNQILIAFSDEILIMDLARPSAFQTFGLNGLVSAIPDFLIDSASTGLYFGDRSGYIKTVDLKTLKITPMTDPIHSGVNAILFHPSQSGQFLAAYSDGQVRWWKTGQPKPLRIFPLHKDFITSLQVDGKNDYLLSGSWDQTIVFTPLTGKGKTDTLFFHTKPVRKILYLADAAKGFSADNSEIKHWDYPSKKIHWSYRTSMKTLFLLHDPIQDLLLAGGGDLDFLDQDPDAAVLVVDARSGQVLKKIKGKEKGFHTVTDAIWYEPGQYNKMIMTTASGYIHGLDISTADLFFTLHGHRGGVTRIRDGAGPAGFLYTSGSDGTLRIWDKKQTHEILQIINFLNPMQFAFSTPDGYFYASRETLKNLYFVRGLQIYSFDQYDLQYNRPDIILERLGNAPKELILAYRKAWEKRLRKMNFDPNNFEKERSFHVPEITVKASTELFSETSDSAFTFSLSATDKLYALERLFVSVNGVPVFGVKGQNLSKTKSLTRSLTIPLSAGKNTVKISVMNEKGVESLAEQIEVTYKPLTPVLPALHVIAVGVSQFNQSDYNLTYADKDARDLSELFRNAPGYRSVAIHLLTNDQATRENVLRLRSELEKTGVDDQVIVFMASHGVLDEDLDYYIAMHNMDFANPRNGGLRYDELEALLDGIPARNKVVLIDACHSGEVDKEETQLTVTDNPTGPVKTRAFRKKVVSKQDIGLKNSFELMKELFADLRRHNGAVVISSAGGKEFAFESAQWKNGVFTYAVLEGLKNRSADRDKNQTITVSELRDYVSARVQQLTNGKQNPTSRTENPENDFKIW